MADRSNLTKPEDTDTSQGKTQRGRSVQQKQTVAQASSQMAVPSNTSQRTPFNYAAAASTAPKITQETVSGKKLRVPEMKAGHNFKPTAVFREAVKESIERLKGESWYEPNALSLCLAVAKEIDGLRKKQGAIDDENYSFMKFQIGPCYSESLGLALKSLQHQADIGCSWEYFEDLNVVAQCFNFQSDNFREKAANKATLAKVYKQFASNELNYLEYMQDFPLPSSVDHASHIFDWLLGDRSPACHFGFLERNTIEKLREKKKRLMDTVCLKMGDRVAGREREKLDELEKKVFSRATDMQAKRKYHDVLRERLKEVMQKSKGDGINDHQRVCLLETLAVFCYQYTASVNEFRSLRQDLKVLMPAVAKKILLAIKDSTENVDQLKVESLVLIKGLGEQNWLNEECRQLYRSCTQPQAVTRAAVQTGKITDTQCKQRIDAIFLRMNSQTDDRFLMAASMLKQLLDESEHEIRKMDTAISLLNSIEKIKETLYVNLFMDIFQQYNHYKDSGRTRRQIDNEMCQYQREFVELHPYVFVLKDDKTKKNWKKTACVVWCNDIVRLSHVNLFTKDHVDRLLYLKDISPSVPDEFVRHHLEKALMKFFKFILRGNTGAVPISNVSEMSEWIDDLDQINPVKPTLKELNEQWKVRNSATASERSMVSSAAAPTSKELLEEVYAIYNRHTMDDYLEAAQLLGSITIDQSWQRKSVNTMKGFLYQQLFQQVFDEYKRLTEEIHADHTTVGREMAKHKEVFGQNKGILFVLKNDEIRENWRKCACVAWEGCIKKLERQQVYSDDDIQEILSLREVAPDLAHPHVRILVKNVLVRIFNDWLYKGGKDRLSLSLLDQITCWIDQPDLQKIWSEKLVRLHHQFKLANQTDVAPAAVKGRKTTTVNTTFEQPVSDVVLVQPKLEEPLISKRKPSSTSTARVIFPEAWAVLKKDESITFGDFVEPEPPLISKSKPSSTSTAKVIFPKAWAGLKKDESITFGDFFGPEQPATIEIETLTEQASQATASLQGVDLPSLKAEHHVPQSTVTAPAEPTIWTSADITFDEETKQQDIQPAFVHPDTLNASLEASSCHPHMRQQTMPLMQPLTAPHSIWAPADQSPSLQPVSVPYSAPIAQSPVATRSHPTPTLQQPLQTPHGVLFDRPTDGAQYSMPSMMPHLPAHYPVQLSSHQPRIPAPVQPQLPTPPQQYHLFQPTMPPKESRAECQLSRGIQQIFARPTEPMGHQPSQMPIQGRGYQQHSEVPANYQAPLSSSSLQYASCIPAAGGSMSVMILHQYSPIGYVAFKMDNSNMILGQKCLFYAAVQYQQQKSSRSHGFVPEISLPTNPASDYFPLFKEGVTSLTKWLLQINGNLINGDLIHAKLMQLGNDDGDAIIRDLFESLLKYQYGIGNLEAASNLFCLRNYLFSIRSLMGMNK